MYCIKSIKQDKKRLQKKRNILVIAGDTQVGLWVVRNLSMNNLNVHAIVRTKSGQSAFSRYTKSAWILESSIESNDILKELFNLAEIVNAASIMPISEGFHKLLINNREFFEPDIHIFSPSKKSFELSTDKDFMHSLCLKLDIPVAKGARLDKYINEKKDALNFPLVLRTNRQNSSEKNAPWKAEYVYNEDQLNKIYNQVKEYSDNIIVQEYCPGVEDHVQILMHKKRAFMVGEYSGIHHMPLAGGVTVSRKSVLRKNLINDSIKLLKAINFDGIAGIQFHFDENTGKYIFLEINPRFIGGTPTLIMAGFDTSFLLWQSRFEPHKMKKNIYKQGIKSRILGGDANRMLAMIGGEKLPPYEKREPAIKAVLNFIKGFTFKDDSFHITDPLPFFIDFFVMIKKLGSKAHDILGNPDTKELKK